MRSIILFQRLLPFSFLGGLLPVLSVGCGHTHPECVEVSGHVTYQSRPVKDGWISFAPLATDGGKLVRPASADLQSDGSYVLKTFRQGDGILPGEYVVAIAAYDYSGATNQNIAPGPLSGRRLPLTVPVKYTSPQTSGLKATISPEASELQFDFDLKD
jgi:hypothetical protein